jgi:hypothetical protein
MPRFERLRTLDWRACLALAWVVWFGLLYGRMLVKARGEQVRSAFSTWTWKADR